MVLLNQLEWLAAVTGIAGILTVLAYILWGLLLSLKRPLGTRTGSPEKIMNTAFYVVGGALYFAICFLTWRPILVTLSNWTRLAALTAGALLLYPGLAMVAWGRHTLGDMYNVSSGFGAQLYKDQRLVTTGPFSIVRHPMYLGILLIALGGILVYRTWTFVFLLANFPGLARRATNEEQALELEFGEQWTEYCKRVPGWLPRLRR